ncbi:hypothetical protein [Bradyrhizobium sp. Gha]|uniref:hypothetical protein n=1 Tax=Bradyrhizobium sp. Gha TaxID=1855318 RepID=UPI000B004E11|nr:hypothetical protein [Bradyrhizobium sp. Gha]
MPGAPAFGANRTAGVNRQCKSGLGRQTRFAERLRSRQTWQHTLDAAPSQLIGLTGDLNGPRAGKEWEQEPPAKSIPVKSK